MVEFGTFFVLVHGNFPIVGSNIISFCAGFATSFLLNRQWVFNVRKGAGRQLALYAVLAGVNVCLSSLIVYAATAYAGMPPFIAKLGAMGLIVLWNYAIFSKVIFADKGERTIIAP